MTFTDAGDAYLRRVAGNLRSAATVAGVVRRFQREWGGQPLTAVTASMIESWQYARLDQRTRVGGRPVSKSGVNHELAILHAFLNWAQLNDLLAVPPRIRRFKVRTRRLGALTDDQSAALLAACTGRRQHLRWLVLMAVNTGMRRGEMLALRWRDVDLEARVIRVLESKNGEPRDVPIVPSMIELLRGIRGEAPAEALVFRHRDGTPYRSVATSWAAACREAGVPGTHLHDLRHTFASRFLRTVHDLPALQELMGHRTAAMSLRYSHAFGATKQAAIDRMDTMTRRAE